MGFREVSVVEVREVLRAWLEGAGLRKVAERAGVDRKTARRYVEAAQALGLSREAGVPVDEAIAEELIGLVVESVRPVRPGGHGAAWESLLGHEEQIGVWVRGGEHDGVKHDPLSVVKIEELLARQGVRVPYRTLHRFAVERCGFRTGRGTTVRVADGEPGVECQVDFARLGLLSDPETGRRRKVHALIFTAVLSRHMFVWLSYSQTQTAVIAGCEAAWEFFGGVFKVLIPDNLTPVVPKADAINPRFSVGWLDYAQHVGFGTDPARVRSPQDKPRVERVVQYVRGNFWAGESFADLADAQAGAEAWCRDRAGMRIHGTTQRRPVEMFAELEVGALLPVPAPYDQPVFSRVKVHRDFHVEVAKALYSVPEAHLGRFLDARADSELVKLYSVGGPAGGGGGRLVKTHPRQPPGGRSTDPADLPEHKAGYAMRDLTRLIGVCAAHGPSIGIYAERLLDDPLPWTRMRSVYRLQGLVSRYGPEPVQTACSRALDLDVVSVSKIAAMLAKATEQQQPMLPAAAGTGHDTQGGRFARDPGEYARPHTTTTRTAPTSVQLTLIPGGDPNDGQGGHP